MDDDWQGSKLNGNTSRQITHHVITIFNKLLQLFYCFNTQLYKPSLYVHSQKPCCNQLWCLSFSSDIKITGVQHMHNYTPKQSLQWAICTDNKQKCFSHLSWGSSSLFFFGGLPLFFFSGNVTSVGSLLDKKQPEDNFLNDSLLARGN